AARDGYGDATRGDNIGNGNGNLEVVLADDDALILEGLATILGARDDISILATAKNGAQAVDRCRELKPQVAVLDIRMPVMDGIQAAGIMLSEGLCAPLLLTTFDEPDLISRALDVGAHGYILKSTPPEQIYSAIATVAGGGTVFAPEIIDFIRGAVHIPANDVFAQLTQRERDIVELIAHGLSNAQIANELCLADGTVRNHISTILLKCGLEHRTQIAVRYYAG
ncbi:MAG: response regulator transcription factor, partial [Coriobacteriales bacterium]|nr:response regulator transcription factor [Coriobacteriales bacterium]